MSRQVRKDPAHKAEIARRRRDRAQRRSGRMHVSDGAKVFLTAHAGGYRLARPS